MKEDYYEALDVDRNFDEAAIKKTYRNMAIEYHPDINPGDAETVGRTGLEPVTP